jgi:hypothetical protein
VAHDTLGEATQQSALYSPAPVAADHNEVRRPLPGSLDDLRGRAPDGKEFQSGRLWRQALTEIADQLFPFLFRQGHQFVGRNAGVGGVAQRRVNDMDERHLGSKRARKLRTDISPEDRS